MKTLDELAMEYAIVSLGVSAERQYALTQRVLTVPLDEWRAEDLRNRMNRDFGVYETQEAIKRARETLQMVIPDQGAIKMKVSVIKDEPGAHPGWRNQHFMHAGDEWRVLTIEERKSSQTAVRDNPAHTSIINEKTRHSYHFDGILTAQAAYEILCQLDGAHEEGRKYGIGECRRAVRQALGL